MEATKYSGEGNGVESGGEEDSGVKDRKDVKEVVKAGLGLDSGENKDVGQITDDSNNTGGWYEDVGKTLEASDC